MFFKLDYERVPFKNKFYGTIPYKDIRSLIFKRILFFHFLNIFTPFISVTYSNPASTNFLDSSIALAIAKQYSSVKRSEGFWQTALLASENLTE